MAYWTTDRSSNGGTEAVNGLIELARRVARGFTNYDNYQLRMLLIAGDLHPATPPKIRRDPNPRQNSRH
ncbi:MAG: transposase [Pseudoclavibacter sp.]